MMRGFAMVDKFNLKKHEVRHHTIYHHERSASYLCIGQGLAMTAYNIEKPSFCVNRYRKYNACVILIEIAKTEEEDA